MEGMRFDTEQIRGAFDKSFYLHPPVFILTYVYDKIRPPFVVAFVPFFGVCSIQKSAERYGKRTAECADPGL